MVRALCIFIAVSSVLFCSMSIASPGICSGPVCADNITRSAKYHWQLLLRIEDQQRHREHVVIDCRSGVLSPRAGLVDRSYATVLGKRACRLAHES